MPVNVKLRVTKDVEDFSLKPIRNKYLMTTPDEIIIIGSTFLK